MTSALEAALRRHQIFSIGALAALALLAWGWLLVGAGMDMDPLFSLAPPPRMPAMPQMDMGGMAGMAGMTMAAPAATPGAWSLAYFALVFSMWWVMMVAMMVPAAAPTILLYARTATHGRTAVRPASASFLSGYLLAWAFFSLVAACLQYGLERSGLLAPMLMSSQSRILSGAILLAGGAYQLSPFKDVCLRHCRSPAQFLSDHYRPGAAGALRMGLIHGSYCVGCCWLLMALLFVGGIMNLAWIALLTLLVSAEKLLPHGRLVAIASGLGCIGWGAALILL